MSNSVSEFLSKNADISKVHKYIDDHGAPVMENIERKIIAGTTVNVSAALTDEELKETSQAITVVEPDMKACFSNSLRVCANNDRFDYVEGYATSEEIGGLCVEHAWCEISGKLVDVTAELDEYHGVTIKDRHILKKYYEFGINEDVWGIIGNYKNHFEFLQQEGYL